MELSIFKPGKTRDVLLLFIIVLAVLLYRRYDAFTHSQLYAEDASVYFIQFEQFGIKSLLMPYGGYLHFVPRLVAILWGILHVNYLYIPVCYCFSEFVITYFIAYNLWATSSYLNIKHRILYASAFLFLPIASDLFMNLTNLNWIVSLYLINYLFVRYTDYTSKNSYSNLIIIIICSLSGPFSALLLPVVIIAAILERKQLTFRKTLPLILIVTGGIIQFIYIKFINIEFRRVGLITAPAEPHHLFRMIIANMNEFLLLNNNFIQQSPAAILSVILIIAFLALMGLLFAVYIKTENKRKYILALYAIITSGAFLEAFWPKESYIRALENSRYYFIPFTCLAWLVILSFDKKIKPVFIAVYLTYFLIQYRYICLVLPDKEWKKQITEYYNGTRQVIDVNPDGWQIILPKRN